MAAACALLLVGVESQRTYAQAPGCALDPKEFAALQNLNQESPDAVREELAIRKTLLTKVLDCLDAEVGAERAELNRTSVSDPRMGAARNNLIVGLEDAARYYQTERERVTNAGLRAAKDVAAAIRDWRANTFLPQQARVHTFISWTRNAEFLAVASRRLEELERSVQLLALIDRDDIQSLFADAEGNFHAAEDFHARAQRELVNGLDPSSSMKLSLEALSRAYASFIELSKLINTLLPRGK